MSYPSAPPRFYQIDVVGQVTRAYRVVIDHAQLVGEIALLPYLILLASKILVLLLPAGGMVAQSLIGLISSVLLLIFATVFTVRWYRFVLLGETVGDGLIPDGWRGSMIVTLKLVAIAIGIVAVGVVPMILVALALPLLTTPLSVLGLSLIHI